MGKGVFEDGGSYLIVDISDINFGHDANGYPTLSSYIPELSAITGDILKYFRGITNEKC